VEKFKPTPLKEASVSENAPFQSQRHATKFTVKWGKQKFKPTLMDHFKANPIPGSSSLVCFYVRHLIGILEIQLTIPLSAVNIGETGTKAQIDFFTEK
jgi:hypothetical protein